ncbi:hypothetical protein THAOC_18404 [Thalassiosira oceanica]|uniref:Uncharacterized protein n=1 Tax=Thalassiosira oceanica TaxID=159749 RepID=K0S7B5_THAOC|nr:hypothetical protein THAOC_18404 [Thalassiosira oceanica]|eukprot:EJK61155.1 hypothetical protein THAOC_18404 [Thalassiosira oceanica]
MLRIQPRTDPTGADVGWIGLPTHHATAFVGRYLPTYAWTALWTRAMDCLDDEQLPAGIISPVYISVSITNYVTPIVYDTFGIFDIKSYQPNACLLALATNYVPSVGFRTSHMSEVRKCLFVDDGAFPFNSREQLALGCEVIYDHFARFGLEMHIGRTVNGKETASKTECVFFPGPSFFSKTKNAPALANEPFDGSIVQSVPVSENGGFFFLAVPPT